MPQNKKDPTVRRRRNKASTAATLTRPADEGFTLEELEALTIAQLREAIDVANWDRPADQQISKKGAKADLIGRLAASNRDIPPLPIHPTRWEGEGEDSYEVLVEWHTQTVSWWNESWTSPMAMQWDDSDLHNMLVLALIYDDIWSAQTAKDRKEAATEFRLQRADLGLSPYSRRRLEWTIETADEAKSRGEKRRGNGRVPQAPPPAGQPVVDPRAHLVAVPS